MPMYNGGTSVLEVIRPGLFTTLQDAGRFGYRQLGVTVGGAMDGTSLALANALVGNSLTTGGIECTGDGPTVIIHHDACIAVVGGQFSISVDDTSVPSGRPLWVRAGSTLKIGPAIHGYRCYLAVRGGFDARPVLASQSTLARYGIGGFSGQVLRKGDILRIVPDKQPSQGSQGLRRLASGVWTTTWGLRPHQNKTEGPLSVRVMPGEQASSFAGEAEATFYTEPFRIKAASDRMGMRLSGPAVAGSGGQMKSEPVVHGSVQVPPDGQPIVLMADCQTVGGYPKIATVIQVDLAALAQARPGTEIRFQQVSLEEAIRVRQANEVNMRRWIEHLATRVRHN